MPQRILHWLTVLLIFFNLLLPGNIEDVADALGEGRSADAADLFWANIHAYVGFAVLALTVLRIVLRVVQGAPAAPAAEPALFQTIAKVAHGLLYLLLLAMPLSGIAKFYLDVDAAGFVHGGPMKLLLWILIVTHIAAVFVHKFYWKTNVLERMTRG
jgi:cytochrome b561